MHYHSDFLFVLVCVEIKRIARVTVTTRRAKDGQKASEDA